MSAPGEAPRREGTVYLVGAGPGDPGLVTHRAHELISSADVLVYDYLVDPALLRWCRRDCEQIYVGKRSGFHAIPQDEIESILVDRARKGLRVVRLKGGDPFIFGRGGEEARRLSRDGVRFEIVPGITAALGAAACAGIPLTQRDASSGLLLVTGHEDPNKTAVQVDWRKLATLEATLGIYMGMGRLRFILSELAAGGLPEDTPAAAVQWASLGRQRTVEGSVGNLADRVEAAGLGPPAVIFVGRVVAFREQVQWFERRPLFGRRIVVTRTRGQAGELREKLREQGAEVIELPLIEIRRKVDRQILEEVFQDFGQYDWLVFSSANGVRYFFEEFLREFADLRSLGLVRIAAVGAATARAVQQYRLKVDLVPEKAVAEDLARVLVETGSLDSAKVLVVSGNLGRDVLVRRLEEARAIVDRVRVYETAPTDLSEHPAAREFRENGADAILFASSSAVESFVAQAGSLRLEPSARRPLGGSIGPMTREAMRRAGIPVDFEASESSLDGLVAALIGGLPPPVTS